MFLRHVDERPHVVVGQSVVNHAALPLAIDEVEPLEEAELMAHCGLGDAQDGGKVARAEPAPEESDEETKAGGVAERCEKGAGTVHDVGAAGQAVARGSHGARVDAADFAVDCVGQ